MNPNSQMQQPSPSQPITPSPGDIAAQIAAAVAANMPQPQQQQQQLTQAQIDELLGTYNPEPELIAYMFGDTATPETRMQALQQLVQGAVTNATKQAQIIAQNAMRELYGHIQEPIEDARYLGQQRFFDDLYKGHDGLKQYDPVIRGTLSALEQQSGYPRERDKRAEFVRNHYISMLKQQDPSFDPTKPRTQTPQPGQPYNPYPSQAAFQAPAQQSYQPAPQQYQSSLPSLGGGGQGAAAQAPQSSGSAERPWAPTLGSGSAAPF